MTRPPLMYRNRGASFTTWSMATSMNSAMYSSTTGRYPASAAPTAMPISAVSEIGVTRTRSPPNALRNSSFSVVAMFCPKYSTRASRAISWLMASLIAAI